jgi:hypothetical protein
MEQGEKSELELRRSLDQLKPVPPRDPDVTARGRAQFLTHAQKLRPPVSAEPFWRHIGWNIFPRKERFSMPILIAVVLAVGLALGGSGLAVSAAQEALPNDPLYAVKLFTEDVRVNLASDPATQVDLLLDFSNRRTQEIAALGAQGMTVPEPVMNRLQEQTQAALQVAAGMDEATMARVLEQMRTRFEAQTQVIARVQAHTPERAAPALSRVQEMLATRLAIVEAALADPHALREQSRHPRPIELPRPTITRTLTVPARPTELPRPTITRTLTVPARPTELPRPTITHTLTVPPHPTELPRPTITRTLTIPPHPTVWPQPTMPPRWQTPPGMPTRRP